MRAKVLTRQFGAAAQQVADAGRELPERLLQELQLAVSEGSKPKAEAIFSQIRNQIPSYHNVEVISADQWDQQEPEPINWLVEGLLERETIAAIIAPSKTKKTFFSLQLAVHMAYGERFLNWNIPTPLRVLFVQMELPAAGCHRRYRKVRDRFLESHPHAERMGDGLSFINGRGWKFDIEAIRAEILRQGSDVVFVDPLYMTHDGVENAAEDVKPILAAFSRLAEETEVTIVYIHHDAKGVVGVRDTRDRGAGSNVIGRHYDTGIFLGPHENGDNLLVLDFLLREGTQEPVTVQWDYPIFTPSLLPAVSRAAVKGAGRTPRPGNAKSDETLLAEILPAMGDRLFGSDELVQFIQDTTQVAKARALDLKTAIGQRPDYARAKKPTPGQRGGGRELYGKRAVLKQHGFNFCYDGKP